jgi:phospholipid N-methyltransferase
MIIIEKCEKRPGLIVGARVYRLVQNDEGVYLLELGKGMGPRVDNGMITNKIIDKIQENREKQYAEKEKELDSADLNSMVDNKKNILIKKTDIKSVKYSNTGGPACLQIKSAVKDITLYFQPIDAKKAASVYEYLK